MGNETEIRRFRGFGDTNFMMLGQGIVETLTGGAKLPEAEFAFDAQGQDGRPWRVRHFELNEGMSFVYEAVVDLASESFTDNPDLLLGRYAALQVQRGSVLRRFFGIVRRVEQRGTTGTNRLARVTLVPALWSLSQRSDARIFQDLTVPEVVQAVFADAGIYADKVHLLLQRVYPAREYTVQYRETDLAFVQRLLEFEGITFFFRHDEDGGEAIVLADGVHAYEPVATIDGGPIPIAADEQHTHFVETVRNLTWDREQRPTSVTVRDFDFTRPDLKLNRVFPRGIQSPRALFEPAPALAMGVSAKTAQSQDDGRDQAHLRFEAEQVHGAEGTGAGDVLGVEPGHSFQLTLAGGHLPDERYLVLRVTHIGDAPEELTLASEREAAREDRYHNRFVCTLLEGPFRPPRVTPRPVVGGIQTAIVTGPPGEEIFTDLYGRIKVRFHWDRAGANDERSTCWIRAVQGPWAGGAWGFSFLPRVGMEVTVGFLDGDPDHPMVLGAVHNGRNGPVFNLPGERTRSGLRTQTVGGTGFNEISFEDAAGEEQVYVHAQRDLVSVVERDHRRLVRHDEDLTVEGDQSEHIVGRRARAVDGDETVVVSGSREARVHGPSTEVLEAAAKLRVFGPWEARFDDLHHQQIGRSHTLQVGENLSQRVIGSRRADTLGDDTTWTHGKHAVTALASLTLSAGDDLSAGADGPVTLTSAKAVRLVCGDSMIELGPREILITARKVQIAADETVSVLAPDASLHLEKEKAVLAAKTNAKVAASEVKLAGKDSEVTLASPGVRLAARKKVEIYAQGSSIVLDVNASVDGTKVQLNCGGASKGEFETAAPDALATTFVDIALVEPTPSKADPTQLEPVGVAGARYLVVGADGTVYTGVLDANGKARVKVRPGATRVSFPDYEHGAVKKSRS